MIKLTKDTLKNKYGDTVYDKLNLHQRIVLNNGGCLTKLLEDLLEEDLVLRKLSEEIHESAQDTDILQIKKGQKIINRSILLSGVESEINHLYAESTIILDNLDKKFADMLLNSNVPIGKLWELLKVETYKTLLFWGDERAGPVSLHFDISAREELLYRTYLVYSHRKPVMQITEKFPKAYTFQPANRMKTA